MKGKVTGGKLYYGEPIGIALIDQVDSQPLIPGNVGNASTYDFPVRLKIIKDLPDNPFEPLRDESGQYMPDIQKTVDSVKELASEGVSSIVMSCGFFSVVQEILVEEVDIPVFSSPLLLVPLLSRMIGKMKSVGIITASKDLLTKDFLEPVGINDKIRYKIAGLEPSKEFYACFMGGTRTVLDIDVLRKEVVSIAKDFVDQNPDIGILLLECSDLPPFAADIQKATGKPVYDFISFVRSIYHSLVPPKYNGFM